MYYRFYPSDRNTYHIISFFSKDSKIESTIELRSMLDNLYINPGYMHFNIHNSKKIYIEIHKDKKPLINRTTNWGGIKIA